MQTNMDCRLIIDPPASGVHNMAVDEALLSDAAEHETATLRFYGWSEPTLSLDTGFTPLVDAPALARRLGVARAWIKNDTVSHPSLSFKDRVVAAAINKPLGEKTGWALPPPGKVNECPSIVGVPLLAFQITTCPLWSPVAR